MKKKKAPFSKGGAISLSAVFLAAVMLIAAMLPVSALADDTSSSTAAATLTKADGTVTEYTSAAAAISAAGDGDTVTLYADAELSSGYLLIKYDITLDLNGHTYTISSTASSTYPDYSYAIFVAGYSGYTGSLTVKNGTITDQRSYNNTTYGWQTFYVYGDACLTLEDVTVQAYQPCYLTYSNTLIYAAAYSSTQCPTINLESGTSLTEIKNTIKSNSNYENYYWVNGVILMGYYSGNSESTIKGDGSTLNVADGAKISVSGYCICGNANYPGTTINITGGTLTSSCCLAIYHPQVGTLNISGGTITAYDDYSAIEMRAGTLNVTGGTIEAVAGTFEAKSNSGGSSIYGAGIAIAQHTTKQSVIVNISGDDTYVSGYYALYEANVQSNDEDSISKVSIHIDDGTFVSTGSSDSADVQAVYSQDCTGFICHGTFISEAEEDLDSKYVTENPCSGGEPVIIEDEDATYVHSLEAVEAVDATCTEDGNIAYYECTYCGAYFTAETETSTDDNGNEVTTTTYTAVAEDEVTVLATGHDYYEYSRTEPTCTEDGEIVYVCANDSSHTYTVPLSASGHDWDYSAPTVTWADDYSSVTVTWTCTVCGETYTATDCVITSVENEDGSVTYTVLCTDPEGDAVMFDVTVAAGEEETAEEEEKAGEEEETKEETAEEEEETVTSATGSDTGDSGVLLWTLILCGAVCCIVIGKKRINRFS